MTFLTVEEVAKRLKTGKTTIYELIRRKSDPLPAYHIPGVRIEEKELWQWVRRQKMSVAA